MRIFSACRFALCIGIILLLTGCGFRAESTAAAMVSEMLSFEVGCPYGVLYDVSVAEGAEGYVSDSLCAALYGDGAVPAEWEYVEDFSAFLSTGEQPVELAVFLAVSSDGAELLAALCARRLTVLRAYYRGTEYEAYTGSARIVVFGRFVVMAVSSDAEAAIDAARRMLG